MSAMQNELEKLVLSGVIPMSSFQARMEAISKIQEFDSAVWTHGFCSGDSFSADDMVLSLMQMDDNFLKHVGVHSVFLKTVSPTLEKNLPILLSKKDRSIRRDEFGDTTNKDWEIYLRKYYKEKIEPLMAGLIDGVGDEIFEEFSTTRDDHWAWSHIHTQEVSIATLKNINKFIEANRADHTPKDIEISGAEYESKIASLINEKTSWTATLTKASGDQGADILVSKSQILIAIQVKYHSAKVGNSAVQEAFSARKYYGADLALVISNSGFTKAASDLAEETGVKLLSDRELMEFLV